MALAVVLIIASLMKRHTCRWLQAAERGLSRLARRRGLSVALVGLLALGGNATLSLLGRVPEPAVHDEFSYLLAADTFARGRLSNPPHPLWVHFESFHIIQQPTYASKYPPVQGLMLAAGQVFGGHPIVGVWISTGLACAAICWMLLVWLPPWWAVLGGLLTALHPGVLQQWGQSYMGGAVAVLGGALVFGALRRIVRRPLVGHTLLLGVGLAVLANSRPYEGLVVSLPVAAVLLGWMLAKNGPTVRVSIGRVVLPLLGVLTLTGGAMGFYHRRVTGDTLCMPYQVHEATYAMAPVFLWQHPRPEATYRHKVMRDFHADLMLQWYRYQRSVLGLARVSLQKLQELWRFYQGYSVHQGSRHLQLVLIVPLVMLPWVVRDSWQRFALLTCSMLMAGLAIETWVFPHYAAPITGLVCALMLQTMRHLRLWHWRGTPTGRLMVWAFLVIAIPSFVVASVQQMRVQSAGWEFDRVRILRQLKQEGGYHLVIVRYGQLHSPHNEWVYNAADIDGAKVVWAREMDIDQKRQLLEYFKDRHIWLAEVDQDHFPPMLRSYPIESHP